MPFEAVPGNSPSADSGKEKPIPLQQQLEDAIAKLLKRHGEAREPEPVEDPASSREQAPPIPLYLRPREDTSREAKYLHVWVDDAVLKFVSSWKFGDFEKFMRDKGRMARGVYALGLPTSNIGVVAGQDLPPEQLAARREKLRDGWRNTVQFELYASLRKMMWEMVRGQYHVIHEVTPGQMRIASTEYDAHALSELLHAMLRADEPKRGETGIIREQKFEITDMLVHAVQEEIDVLEETLAPGWKALPPAEESDRFNIGFLNRERIGQLSVFERTERLYQMLHLAKELNAIVESTVDGAGNRLINSRVRIPERGVAVPRNHFAVLMNEYAFDLGFMSGMGRYAAKEFSLQQSAGLPALGPENLTDLAANEKAFFKAAKDLPDTHLLDSLNRLAHAGLLPLYNELGDVTALLKSRRDVDPAYLSELAQKSLGIAPTVRQERPSVEDAVGAARSLAERWKAAQAESGRKGTASKKRLSAELEEFFQAHGKNDSMKLLAQYLEPFTEGPDVTAILAPIIETRIESIASVNLRAALIDARELRKAGYGALITDAAIKALALRAKDVIEEMLTRTSSQDAYLFLGELASNGLAEFVLTEEAAALWSDRILAHDIEFSRAEVYQEDIRIGAKRA